MNGISKALKVFAILSGAVCAALALSFWAAGYDTALLWLSSAAGVGEKAGKIAGWFPATRFPWLLAVLALAALFFFGIAWKAVWLARMTATGLSHTGAVVRVAFGEALRSPVRYFLILPAAASVYYAATLPVNYDEAWTYLTFTTQSPLVSLTFYPVPNNHILHSLVTHVTQWIPGFPVLFRLRLSAIAANLCIWVVAYAFARRFYGEKTALGVTGLGAVWFMSVYYSCMSRGYVYVVLFFVVALFAAYRIVRSGGRMRHWTLFSLCSVLGFFTMPSFLYPYLTLNVWMLWARREVFRRQFLWGLCTACAVVALYLPVIVVSGVKSLAANPFVRPIAREETLRRLPSFFAEAALDIFGLPYWAIGAIAALSMALFFLGRDAFHARLAAVFAAMPVVLLAAHSVIPFSRTFVYYTFVFTLLAVAPWQKAIERMKTPALVLLVLAAQILLLWNFHRRIAGYEVYNTSYHRINLEIAGPYRYYFNSRTFDTNLAFELKTRGLQMKGMQRNFPPLYVSADSITGFDYIIIDKEFDRTTQKEPVLSDPWVNVYR